MIKIHTILFSALVAFYFIQERPSRRENGSISAFTTVDGPYVFYNNDSIFVKYIQDDAGTKSVRSDAVPVSQKDIITLKVNTDIPGKTFDVLLKQKLVNEKSEYNRVKKMLVISDIEGNFEAFRKLLEVSGVIDSDFNWTFGNSHLVLTGDFVDRGNMVMEVLWLIYSLEEKAKAAGGYVHFILGNHEIMNMSGDINYVHERYIQHSMLLYKYYMQIFGKESEIGRWLSTKNIAERVGNVLFTHGGFSSYMNNIRIPLDELNNISRPYYTDSTYQYKDLRLDLVYSDYGPFWYRGYYKAPKAQAVQIDSTLDFYGVRHISTGHTVIANQITSLYNGKLIDTDVHHAGGHSEALLIDGGKFWRINSKGEQLAVKSYDSKG